MIRIKNLNHIYRNRKENSLNNVSLNINKGEILFIIGPNGSGKSTLLKCINRLEEPTSGKIYIDNRNIIDYPVKRLRSRIGMIFQNFNLIERETVLNNVLNGCLRFNHTFDILRGRFSEESYKIAMDNIKMVELEQYENDRVNALSGGQRQRVSIARTLSQKPEIILADEPISSLDPKLMVEITTLLKNICLEKGITLVSSLHSIDFVKKYGLRIVGINEGRIVFDGVPEALTEDEISKIYNKKSF